MSIPHAAPPNDPERRGRPSRLAGTIADVAAGTAPSPGARTRGAVTTFNSARPDGGAPRRVLTPDRVSLLVDAHPRSLLVQNFRDAEATTPRRPSLPWPTIRAGRPAPRRVPIPGASGLSGRSATLDAPLRHPPPESATDKAFPTSPRSHMCGPSPAG